jgi:hypothetical protein
LLEQGSQVPQHFIGCPFDVDREAYGIGIKVARPFAVHGRSRGSKFIPKAGIGSPSLAGSRKKFNKADGLLGRFERSALKSRPRARLRSPIRIAPLFLSDCDILDDADLSNVRMTCATPATLVELTKAADRVVSLCPRWLPNAHALTGVFDRIAESDRRLELRRSPSGLLRNLSAKLSS